MFTGSSGASGAALFADRVLYIGNGNTSDDRDIGFVGRYQDGGGTDYLTGIVYETSQLDNDGKVGAYKFFHGRTTITEPAKTYAVPDGDLAIVDLGTLRGGSALGADNTAGTTLTITGGLSTGNATGGTIVFKTGGTGAGAAVENTPTTALTLSNAQLATFAGNVTVSGTGGITLDQGATIVNTDAQTLTITEATTVFTGNATVSGNTLTFGNGATVVNGDGSTLTITEATTVFSGNATISGNTLTFGNGATVVNGDGSTLTITEATTVLTGDLTVSGNDLDFAAGNANIGASAGGNTITIGGATTTVAVAGSLVVNGTSIDVDAASALTVGATVGANNLTLGGATSTVISAGDLEVQGQAVLDDSTITIGAAGAQNIAVTKSFHKITPDAGNNSITLITGGETGSILVLMHSGAGGTLTLTNDGTSNTANALALDGGNIVLANNSTATLIYNGNNWSLISKMINS
jgi:hypothetical protein